MQSNDEDTKKRNGIKESAGKVRAAYDRRFFTASELRGGSNLRRQFRYNYNEAQTVSLCKFGWKHGFYRPGG